MLRKGDRPFFVFSSRRRHTRFYRDWSSDVCSSDLDISHEGRQAVDESIRGTQEARVRMERSEERRVGKEGRSRWSPYHYKKKRTGQCTAVPRESPASGRRQHSTDSARG